ncbi:MAG: hypothetical protein ACJ8F7_02590, partial [Gemmataceae bacterium]
MSWRIDRSRKKGVVDEFGPVCAALGLLALLPGAIVLLLRWLTRKRPTVAPGQLPPRCQNCAHTLPSVDARCRACGLLPSDAEEVAELRITERHLRQLRIAGVIDDETFGRIHIYLRQRREDLAEFPAAPTRPEPSEAILEVLPVEEPPAPGPVAAAEIVPAPIPERRVEPNVPPASPSPPAPRRPLGHWLAAFMEERNILWGELAGGLLMVGCSVALVLSLWKTLEQIPLFPFLVLTAITATLFGIGSYTLHHWKLEATSRGLLVIALLLVPLNFLVLAGLSPRDTGTPVEILIKVAGIALFAVLTYRGSRNLFPTEPGDTGWRRFASDGRLLMLAVMGISVTPLPVPRLLEGAESPGAALLALSAWPVLCHAAAIGIALRRRWNMEPGLRWLGWVGLATFPLALGLGFAVVWTGSQGGNIELLLEHLAPLIAVAAATISAAGLLVSQRRGEAKLPAVLGTIVALTGMLIQLAALVAAWPNPVVVIAVGGLIFSTWTAAAVGFRLPVAHAIALPGLVVAFLASVHLVLAGSVLGRGALLSGDSGAALMGLAYLLAVVADRLRTNCWNHGVVIAGGAAAVAAASLLLVGVAAAAGPMRAVLVGLAATGGCFLLERRWRIRPLGQIAFLLLPPTTLAALLWLWPGHVAEWGTVLALGAAVLSLSRRNPLSAVALACLGSVGCFFAAHDLGAPAHPFTLAAWAGVCVVQAQRARSVALAWLGAGWLLVAVVAAFEDFVTWRMPASALAMLLTHATLLLPVVIARRAAWLNCVRSPLTLAVKIGCGAAAIGLVLAATKMIDWPALAVYSAWLALLWLVLAAAERRPIWFTMHQAAVVLAVYFIVSAGVRPATVEETLVRHFDLFALPLAALAIIWTAIRLWKPDHAILRAPWPALERGLAVLLAGWFGVLAAVNAFVAARTEFQPLASEFGLVVPMVTPGFWDWPVGARLLVVGLLVALALNVRTTRSLGGVTVLVGAAIVVVLTIPLLAALPFEPQRASASALRWGL